MSLAACDQYNPKRQRTLDGENPSSSSFSLTPLLSKPLALIFYPIDKDHAFDVDLPDTQKRFKTLENSYELQIFHVRSIFEAHHFAESIYNSTGRPFAYLELSGHGNQKELTFDKSIEGGVISINSDQTIATHLKSLIHMVEPHGIILTQSCENGSKKLPGINLLQHIAQLTKIGQRVLGSSTTKVSFQIYGERGRHFHSIETNTENDVTCIYQRTVKGEVQCISIHLVEKLWYGIFGGDESYLDLCFEMIGEIGNPESLHELIETKCPYFADRMITYFSNLFIRRDQESIALLSDLIPDISLYFLNRIFRREQGTVWANMLKDLESLSELMGHQGNPQITLSPQGNDSEDALGLQQESGSDYIAKYQYLLRLAVLEHYFDIIKILDTRNTLEGNPAVAILHALTGERFSSGTTSMDHALKTLQQVKEDYLTIKELNEDFHLYDLFSQGISM